MKNAFQGTVMMAAVALTLTATAFGQQLPGAAPAGGPTPEEVADLQKIINKQIQNVQDVDDRVKAVDAFVLKYPNSTVKAFALGLAGEASQMKNDHTKAVFYYEEALKADPKDYNAMLMISMETAQTTSEFDLKKEEKLGRAEKLAKQALELVAAAQKPNPNVTDEQWAAVKKDDTARGHEALGMIGMVRKTYPEAAKEFQMAIDAGASPQPSAYIRMGGALNEAGQYDAAVAALDKVLAMQGLPDVYKSVAENEKKRAGQLKNAKK
jgi:tetratricopeptide (TPR) repeat protein